MGCCAETTAGKVMASAKTGSRKRRRVGKLGLTGLRLDLGELLRNGIYARRAMKVVTERFREAYCCGENPELQERSGFSVET